MEKIQGVAPARAGAERLRVILRGAVQGVGFRPFVYRLANEIGLTGWVLNSSGGLIIEVEGGRGRLDEFVKRLELERPGEAVVHSSETSFLKPAGFARFEIRTSDAGAGKTAGILPDLATCPACRAEIMDPANRRFGYPFTNCTHCGPRFTILLEIPYDRPHTTMRGFRLCPECSREYADPADRRFHAQPNACPRCGPRIWIEPEAAPAGTPALRQAAIALGEGRIVALKGIGGFQLLADARQPEAVDRLRRRKHREEKPFALMAPSLEAAATYCIVSPAEAALLESAAAPVVLLRPKGRAGIASNVARSSPYLGVMLPYSPLHHLLMKEFPFPVVATSGNLSDEPIATDNEEARRRLGGIADLFLMHDRPIARPCDDSVIRLARGGASVMRRARGYAPLPVQVTGELRPVLAVGAHLKNTVAIAVGRQVFLSQHVGDLDTLEARSAFERAIEGLCGLYDFQPQLAACDLHPDYASTRWARACGLPVTGVQHHHAHVAACAAENGLRGEYLGVAWDGAGYGLDGTIWGGEFFLARGAEFERVAHLRPFRLPGGEAAIRQGWRVAAAILWEMYGPGAIPGLPARHILERMLEQQIQAPLTTSVGRLFDAVASLAGVAQESRFEGQAAMLLEREIGSLETSEAYQLSGDAVADWAPLVEQVRADAAAGAGRAVISARFHNALAEWIARVAERVGTPQVVLSGGVFQNRYLMEKAASILESRRFTVYTHRQVPANDGGIALGQAVLAGR
jgi:hydrogenase maturation protein HypF